MVRLPIAAAISHPAGGGAIAKAISQLSEDENVVYAAGNYLSPTPEPKVSRGIVRPAPARTNGKGRMNQPGARGTLIAWQSSISAPGFGISPILDIAGKGGRIILGWRGKTAGRPRSARKKP